MMSNDLININLEVYKYKSSDVPSRNMWQLHDIISVIYIIYTHNFYIDGKPRISALNNMLVAKICPAIPKPLQVQLEINIETGVTFFAKFMVTLCC